MEYRLLLGGFGVARGGVRGHRRPGAQRRVQGPHPGARRGADPLGDPYHRLGADVGVDAQRPVRHHQPPADGARHHRQPHRLDRRCQLLHVGGDHGRRVEDHAVRRPAGAGGIADAAQGLLRSRRGRRYPPGQGVLPRHSAADHPGADGSGDLPPARCTARVRRDLRAHLQLHQHHVDVDLRPPTVGGVPGRGLRQRRFHPAVPDHRPGDHRLSLSGPQATATGGD